MIPPIGEDFYLLVINQEVFMPMQRVEELVESPMTKSRRKVGEAKAIQYLVRDSNSFVPIPNTVINPTCNCAIYLLHNIVPC